MAFCLTDGALLAVGTAEQPVDLVHGESGVRVPLTSDEASVTALLVEAASSEEELLGLARQFGVRWTVEELTGFLHRLSDAGLVHRIDLPRAELGLEETQPAAAPPPLDEGPTEAEEASGEPTATGSGADDRDTLIYKQRRTVDGEEPTADLPSALTPHPFELPDAPAAPRAARRTPESSRAQASRAAVPELSSKEPSLQPLALAARLMGEGKLDEAAMIIEAIRYADPNNVYAKAMANLLSRSQAAKAKTHRSPWGLIVVGAVLLLMSALVVAVLLFR
jgi:hypothetical protein